MYTVGSTLNEATFHWCCTEGKLHKFTYIWKIKNFSRYDTANINIYSSYFKVGLGGDESVWLLYLKNADKSNESFLSLHLCLESCKKPEFHGKLKFAILDSANKETHARKFDKTYSLTQSRLFGIESFIHKNFLSKSVVKDTLTIMCEGTISPHMNYNIPSNPTLIDDLKKFFESETFSDVTFVVSDQEIKAHKIILAARSEVFAAMFSHEMEEQRTNHVVISDIDHDVFKEMLLFIYTEESPNLDKMANDLLVAADKYQLGKLKTICEDAIAPKISVDKAAEILILADRHSADQLKKRAIEFITQNAPEVMQTEDWKKLTVAQFNLIIENLWKITHK